ncbi:hypothetical protein FJZ48_03895 [Candidatus Uhrbacteria bacterium]|nr:hypothetical protein [Candidatus Uhrbacteria bacterium]
MLEKESTRKNILRGFAVAVLIFGCFATVPRVAFAQNQTFGQKNVDAIAETSGLENANDLPTLIGNIINVALGFMGIVLLGYLLYAGFLWMTSGGEDEKVKQAKTMIRNAVIGLVLIVSSFAIANFILSRLGGAIDGGGGVAGQGPGGVGFPGSSGSLGGGIIEYHVPERDATNIPRNTAIVMTFKIPLKIASVIQDYNDNGTPALLTDDATSGTTIGLNPANVRIYPTGKPDKALVTADARVRFTADRKTFVIKPVNYLGSPTEKMNYTVELIGGTKGLLREDGKAAFSGSFSKGYKWQFEVSTVIDTTPPKITTVIPSLGGRYAPNIVVQVHFNEAVDPTSASGIFKDGAGFTNMELRATPIAQPNNPPTRPAGEFKVSNRYTTVEFVSDVPCGVNSCGKKIFCLPKDSAINVLVKAATLSSTPPEAELTQNGYDGIVDIVGNSLDGNGNATAEGRGKDDYTWGFGTESEPNLIAPFVKKTKPKAGDRQSSSNIPVQQPPEADFDSILQSSTLTSDTAFIRTNEAPEMDDTFWWTPKQFLLTADGRIATSSEPVVAGRVSISHRLYLPAPEDKKKPSPEYYPYLISDLQNVYQNCYIPAGSTVCKGPNCCDDSSSKKACAYPVKK